MSSNEYVIFFITKIARELKLIFVKNLLDRYKNLLHMLHSYIPACLVEGEGIRNMTQEKE